MTVAMYLIIRVSNRLQLCPHGMAEENGATCDLDVTLYQWTQWVHCGHYHDRKQLIYVHYKVMP